MGIDVLVNLLPRLGMPLLQKTARASYEQWKMLRAFGRNQPHLETCFKRIAGRDSNTVCTEIVNQLFTDSMEQNDVDTIGCLGCDKATSSNRKKHKPSGLMGVSVP